MAEHGEEKDFQNLISDAFPDHMITNWIIIAEVVDNDSRDLHVGTSEGMTTWLASGMLKCASEIILNGDLEGFFDNGEEGSDS